MSATITTNPSQAGAAERRVTVERALRGVAGGVVLLSLALAWAVHPYFLGLTAFAGLNNLQSAFTDWCPMVWLLEKLGLPRCGAR